MDESRSQVVQERRASSGVGHWVILIAIAIIVVVLGVSWIYGWTPFATTPAVEDSLILTPELAEEALKGDVVPGSKPLTAEQADEALSAEGDAGSEPLSTELAEEALNDN